MLTRLQGVGLILDPTKCHFKVERVKYPGLIYTTHGIEMDPKKVYTVVNQPAKKARHVQSS